MSKQKLKKLADKVAKLNEEIRSVYNDGLKEYAEEIFNRSPKLKGFSWTQYTPYFNDGEPCEFGINGDYPKALIEGNEDYAELSYEIIRNKGTWAAPKYEISESFKDLVSVEEAEKMLEDIRDFMSQAIYPFENQVQSLLGEGEVIVTPDGIEVEDYDHD